MNNLQKLYQEFIDLGLNDYHATISLFEKNKELLASKIKFNDFLEFHYHIIAFTRYTSSIEGVGRYRNSLDYVAKTLNLIEKSSLELKKEITNTIVYSDLLLIKGRCHYNLSEYKKSSKIFMKLVLMQPENDYYMNWYKSSMTQLRNKYILPFYAIGFSLMLFVLIVPDLEINKMLLKISLTIILAAMVMRIFHKHISDLWDGKTGANKRYN